MHNAQKAPKIRLLNLAFLSHAAAHVKLSPSRWKLTKNETFGAVRSNGYLTAHSEINTLGR